MLDAVAIGLLAFEEVDARGAAGGAAAAAGVADVAGFELGDDELAGLFAAFANEHVGRAGLGGVAPAVLVADGPVRSHDVDHGELVRDAQVVVVGIVRGRDFEEAGGELGLRITLGCLLVIPHRGGQNDILVFDDGDDAPDDRELDEDAAEGLGAWVLRIQRDGGVAQIGLGARRGDGHPGLLLAGVLIGARIAAAGEFVPGNGLDLGAALGTATLRVAFFRPHAERGGTQWALHRVHQRIPQVIEERVNVFVIALIVGDGGLQHRIPVHEALAAVNQAVFEEAEERFTYGPRADVVHREALAAEIARAAHGLELVGDAFLVLVLPLLHERHELLAGVVLALLALLLHQSTLDHGLRGDAGVIGSGHPQRFEPHHAMRASQDVLQRVVERVAEVQCARDVGRRDQDAVWLGLAGEHTLGVGLKGPCRIPFRQHP